MQEEIANTYFKTAQVSKKNRKNIVSPSNIFFALAIVTFISAVVVLISQSNIDIRIKVLSRIPFITKESVDDGAVMRPVNEGLFFVKGGEINDKVISKAFFVGDARAASKVTGDGANLRNSKGQGWASYRIEMKHPLDLRKSELRYMACGENGGESLFMIVVDSDNKSYRLDQESSKLTKEWQAYTINFKPLKDVIDLANISAVRFEFGSYTAGNPESAAITLKDIYITKARKIKWQ